MQRVWLSVGSNQQRRRHIGSALRALQDVFGELLLSPVYESAAVGFQGDDFYNLVAGFDTRLEVVRILSMLKEIEDRHGRKRKGPRFASRTLDLDLLTYGDQILDTGDIRIPRDEILHHAFVLGPLAAVAGEEIHPGEQQSYARLWAGFPEDQRRSLRELPWPDTWPARSD